MCYDFDTLVNRQGIGNMKYMISPKYIKDANVISFAGAEMDFKTAPSVIESIIKRAENGLLGFTLCDENYRKSVHWWMKTQRNFEINDEWIVPTLGTIHSVATAIRMITKEGEGVIVQQPVYSRYEQAVTRLHRKIVYNDLINNDGTFYMDFKDLEEKMANSNNKLFILCNPHNPVGRVWRKEDLERIAELANQYGILIFSDEIYAEITFDNHNCIPYSSIAGTKKHAITSTSLGKTFNFTGVNHANMLIADEELRNKFIEQRNADHYGSLDPLIHAAICGAYSEEGANWKDEMVTYVKNNMDYICEFLHDNLPMIKVSPPEGGFILWLDFSELKMSDKELYDFLEQEALLELEHGTDYGESGSGFLRMSVACPKKEIEKAMERLISACREKGFI